VVYKATSVVCGIISILINPIHNLNQYIVYNIYYIDICINIIEQLSLERRCTWGNNTYTYIYTYNY